MGCFTVYSRQREAGPAVASLQCSSIPVSFFQVLHWAACSPALGALDHLLLLYLESPSAFDWHVY